MFTDQPGLQFYTGDMLPPEKSALEGKDSASYSRRSGFCLESQIFPNAVNHPGFGVKSVWSPGEIYEHRLVYKVGADEPAVDIR